MNLRQAKPSTVFLVLIAIGAVLLWQFVVRPYRSFPLGATWAQLSQAELSGADLVPVARAMPAVPNAEKNTVFFVAEVRSMGVTLGFNKSTNLIQVKWAFGHLRGVD